MSIAEPLSLSKFIARKSEQSYVEPTGEESSRTIYHHDRAEITYCPFFRRLAFRKYHYPDRGPEARTRLLHSIEVATMASGMARRLGLDVDLTEAIALGHDIANPPLGYPAEQVLREFLKDDDFDHASVGRDLLMYNSFKFEDENETQFAALRDRGCYHCERLPDGRRAVSTLSQETLDGIGKHTPPNHGRLPRIDSSAPRTLEGQLVRIADTLSYISQEIHEAIQMDKSYVTLLRSYATRDVFQVTNSPPVQKTRLELQAPAIPGSPHSGPEFLQQVFSPAFGPRVMAMIGRFEEYTRTQVHMKQCKVYTLHMASTGPMPILAIDPILEFIINFLWQEFIDQVNQRAEVKRVVGENRDKMHELTGLLFEKSEQCPGNGIDYWRSLLSTLHEVEARDEEWLRKRAVASHVCCMTDQEVEDTIDLLGDD